MFVISVILSVCMFAGFSDKVSIRYHKVFRFGNLLWEIYRKNFHSSIKVYKNLKS